MLIRVGGRAADQVSRYNVRSDKGQGEVDLVVDSLHRGEDHILEAVLETRVASQL